MQCGVWYVGYSANVSCVLCGVGYVGYSAGFVRDDKEG